MTNLGLAIAFIPTTKFRGATGFVLATRFVVATVLVSANDF